MDNSYSKGGNTNNQPEPVKTVPIKMPKNIRQIGSIGARNKVIYVEDYVMTYIRQLSDKEHSGCKVAVLLGYYVRTEEGKNIFIKGAVEMMNSDFSSGIAFSDEGWTSIYENIKQYFNDVEIVGWSLIGPEFFIEGEEKLRKIHTENFSGPDKVLLKMDSLEKEEAFYLNENNHLIKQNGYYIYYEKNEEMQNYMVENKETASEEKNYSDHTTRKIRNVIQEKKDVKDDRSIIRLLYAASTLLAIIVLVIAATMLDNYEKMRNMETALNSISQSLNMGKEGENVSGDDTEQTGEEVQAADTGQNDTSQVPDADSDKAENSQTAEGNNSGTKEDDSNNQTLDDSRETTEVETVKGNINSTEDTDNSPADSSTDTASADNQGNSNSDNAEDEADSNDSAQTSAQVKYYIVRAGDSLAAISYELYHTYSYMEKIKELNGIEDENKIYEGQKLIVP